MAIQSYREEKKREEKAVDVVVAATIYPSIFFFSFILGVFSCRIILRNQKKNRCSNTFCPHFLFFLYALANLKFADTRQYLKNKKKGKHQLQSR
jgi:hypothetical protein